MADRSARSLFPLLRQQKKYVQFVARAHSELMREVKERKDGWISSVITEDIGGEKNGCILRRSRRNFDQVGHLCAGQRVEEL